MPERRCLSDWTVRVLLVEDESRDASVLADVLGAHEEVSFQIAQAGSIERALRVLRDDRFDVMVLNLSLPEGHGLTAFLRAKQASATLPIVVLADEEDESLALDAIDRGAQEYLVKKDLRVLPRVILNAISRHRTLSALREARQRENFLATHDPLTGLFNRYAFIERLRESIARARRTDEKLAVLFVDLDGFKPVNDTLGHPVGDQLLLDLAHRIRENVRAGDIPARYGGDEFTLLLHNAKVPDGVAILSERLLRSLREPLVLAGEAHSVTASIGIAVWPDDAADADGLLRSSDSAMYQAKQAGRDRYHFYSRGLNAAVSERLRAAERLRGAVEAEQLVLHYQPRVDVSSRRLTGVEALLRWRDPDGGVTPARDFLATAERLGLIWSLGERALREACRQLAIWQKEVPARLRMAVNVSSRQLHDPRFVELVRGLLRDGSLDAEQLEVEVLQDVALQASSTAVATLHELGEAGVRVALDDFVADGTGLRALQRLPVATLKIGRALFEEIDGEPVRRAFVGSMLHLARSLDCEVVAHGVETESEMRALAGLGCRQMQGLLFGEARAAPELDLSPRHAKPRWLAVAGGKGKA